LYCFLARLKGLNCFLLLNFGVDTVLFLCMQFSGVLFEFNWVAWRKFSIEKREFLSARRGWFL
jgi:hypothetical protein